MLTKKDLNNLRYYIAERERLINEVDKYSSLINYGYKSPDFTEKKSGKVVDITFELAMHNIKYEKLREKKIKRLNVIIIKLYKIIDKINDQEMRQIIELRAVYGHSFKIIGENLGLEQSTVRKKYNAYIEDK